MATEQQPAASADLERIIDAHIKRQQENLRYWMMARDISKLFIVEVEKFSGLLNEVRGMADQVATLTGKGVDERMRQQLTELLRLMELWYTEVIDNEDELRRHQPHKDLFARRA